VVAGSTSTRGYWVPTPTQHVIHALVLLMSASEGWGVNGHTTRCHSHVSVVLQLTDETEINDVLWAY